MLSMLLDKISLKPGQSGLFCLSRVQQYSKSTKCGLAEAIRSPELGEHVMRV